MLQQVAALSVLGDPQLDAGGVSPDGRNGQNLFPCPAGHAALDETQDWIGSTAHWLQVHIARKCPAAHPPASPSPSEPGCSWSACSQSVLFLSQVQHLAVSIVKLRETPMGPFLELVQVPLDGIPSFRCVTCKFF